MYFPLIVHEALMIGADRDRDEGDARRRRRALRDISAKRPRPTPELLHRARTTRPSAARTRSTAAARRAALVRFALTGRAPA
jgi:glycine cleavage system protein P-like pyridoxal-binding family